MPGEIHKEQVQGLALNIYNDTVKNLERYGIELNIVQKQLLKMKTKDGVDKLIEALKIEIKDEQS